MPGSRPEDGSRSYGWIWQGREPCGQDGDNFVVACAVGGQCWVRFDRHLTRVKGLVPSQPDLPVFQGEPKRLLVDGAKLVEVRVFVFPEVERRFICLWSRPSRVSDRPRMSIKVPLRSPWVDALSDVTRVANVYFHQADPRPTHQTLSLGPASASSYQPAIWSGLKFSRPTSIFGSIAGVIGPSWRSHWEDDAAFLVARAGGELSRRVTPDLTAAYVPTGHHALDLRCVRPWWTWLLLGLGVAIWIAAAWMGNVGQAPSRRGLGG